jgi:hypothetical protein
VSHHGRISYENSPAFDLLQHLHDHRLVRAPEVPARSAHYGDRGERMIAFLEYCFQVPANRIGYGEFTAFQLKIIQEVITLAVFSVFAWIYFGEEITWNYGAAFLCIVGAVAFAFWGKM